MPVTWLAYLDGMSTRRSLSLALAISALAAPAAAQQDAPAGGPRPAGAASGAPAAQGEDGGGEADASPLLPPGEQQRMAPHPVGPVRYVPGKGLRVDSADGDFRLDSRLRVQTRYTLVHDEQTGETQQSLKARRARLAFEGHWFGEHNEFKIEIAISPNDIGLVEGVGPRRTPLLDAYFDFTYLRDLSVRVGQYKIPFNRERVISSGNLEFVDRSITNAEFNIDRDFGVELRSTDLGGLDRLRYHVGLYTAEGRDPTELDDPAFMYLARLELLPFGTFDDYSQLDFARTLAPRLSIGIAHAFIDDAERDRGVLGAVPADGGTTDIHVSTADAVFMYGGLAVTSQAFVRFGDRNPGEATDEGGNLIPPVPSRDGYGFTAQGSYLLPELPVAFAARYSLVRPFDEDDSSLPPQNEVGANVGWYIARHPLKLEADYFHLWNEDIGQGEDRVRIQLQASL